MGTVRNRRRRAALRLLDGVGSVVLGGTQRRPITIEAVRRATEKRIGYDDWGLTPDFERASELLEKDLADHPVGFLGRFLFADTLSRHHANRLRLRRAFAASPTVGLQRPPYVVTGLFRTGTTLMHQLLAALPDRDYVPAYELMCPVPEPGREADARTAMRATRFLGPEIQQVHPVRWDGPEECWMLIAPTLRVQDFTVMLDVPAYQAWLDECDMLEAYVEYRKALEILDARRQTGLVVKCPTHLANLEPLSRALPEARIVVMHRDPAKAVASYCSLSALHHRTFYGSFDPDTVGKKVLERFARFVEVAAEQRRDVPPQRILDVRYEDLVDDPVATVRRIVEHFGDPWTDEAEQAVRSTLAELTAHKYGKHHYSAAQWGLTADGIRDRFADYLTDWDLRRESC